MKPSKRRRRSVRAVSEPAKRADVQSRAPVTPVPRPRAASGQTPGPVTLLAPLAVLAITVIAYANAAANVIVHDDRYFYPSRIPLGAQSVIGFFRQDVWGAATGSSLGGLYRPLLLTSFALDSALFGGSALAAHLENIVLHVTATLALYVLLVGLLRAPRPPAEADDGRIAPLAAAGAALVFGVHPIHTEVVDSIFNRSEMLVTLGVLGALVVLWRWEERYRLAAWSAVAGLYLVALFCRESAISLPALAILLLVFMRPRAGTGLHRFGPAALLLLPLAAYLMTRHAALAAMPPSSVPPLAEHPPPEGTLGHLAFALASVAEYVRMVVWPHPLRVSYEDFAGGALLALPVHAGLLGLLVLGIRRTPALAFGIAFFYLALLPSTRILTDPAFELSLGGHVLFHPDPGVAAIAERIVYLPSVGLAVPLAFGLAALSRRAGARAVVAAGVALVAVLVPVTRARNLDWRSGHALADAEVRGAPENGDAWRMYVGVLLDEKRHREIVDVCDRQAALHQGSAQLQNSCGAAYAEVGRFDDAVTAYRRAIEGGLAAAGHANLGRIYARMDRADAAEQEFRLAAEAEKDPAMHHFRLGQLLERFHPERLDEAAREYRRALDIRPGYGAAQEALRRTQPR